MASAVRYLTPHADLMLSQDTESLLKINNQREKRMKRAVLAVLLVFVVSGCNDSLSHYDRYDYLYCDNVSMWQEDTYAGVPLHDRRGWAPILDDHIECPSRHRS